MSGSDNSPPDVLDDYVAKERDPHREPSVRITGLMVQYYVVCRRELWFMSRGIDIDRETVNIRRGTHVDEKSYRDKRRSFQINGRIAIDLLETGDVMEVKVSSKMAESARMQLLYYLWYLDRVLGIERQGILAYPRERKRQRVTLDDNRAEIEEVLRGILETVRRDTPPVLKKKPVCKSCLYQDICWV